MSTRRGWVGWLAVLAMVGALPGVARAGPAVRLVGWAGEGTVIRGHGQGPDLIQLVAEGEWDPAAPRDPARYSVRVAMPDGRVDSRPFPVGSPPGRRRFPVYVPAAWVRNLDPGLVRVAASVVDVASGLPASNALEAGIEDFPRPRGDASSGDPGPFGRGRPLEGTSRILPEPGPDGSTYARIPAQGDAPGFFLATTEATVRQVGERLPGYDPKAGRSDEFALEKPEQPAIGLTPAKALDYLKALGQADPSGVAYRLPTVAEWSRAARGGQASAFWWGDQPSNPEGANFLGPEPAQPVDATAPSRPPAEPPTFRANPFGLAHTFGNADEWATAPGGGFARMGGHFRTEPASPLPEVTVPSPDAVGADPFVGVRPAFDLAPEAGSELARRRLAADPRLKKVAVAFDPDRATLTLTGSVPDASSRRAADSLLGGLWFVAAVEDRLETPRLAPRQLAVLGPPTGPIRKVASLGKTYLEIPLSARWLDPLPVSGSDWWVNIYLPGGGHLAHRMAEGEPARVPRATALVDRDRMAAAGLADDAPISVALSLGGPAPTPAEPNVVSNVAEVRPAKSR